MLLEQRKPYKPWTLLRRGYTMYTYDHFSKTKNKTSWMSRISTALTANDVSM